VTREDPAGDDVLEAPSAQEFLAQAMGPITAAASRLADLIGRLPPRDRTDEALDMLAVLTERLPGVRAAGEVLARERDTLRALTSVGQAVNSSLDLTEVLHLVMDHIIELTGAERGLLMLRSEETGEM
jgi:DNA-binding IclR family transcriptional regulator